MTGSPLAERSRAHPWPRFVSAFGSAGLGFALALYLFVLATDPYGRRAGPGREPTPIMDVNQRFMYPRIIRSGRYDSAVFGTSTIRLLDPERLGELFAGRFANLGLNAGTPWEQVQLIDLFLRHVPQPRTLILGIDPTWCEADADRKRLTSRAFPPWLYDEDPLNDLPRLLNLKSLEIAFRVVLWRLGLMRERVRSDGYEVFVPPERSYDLARARAHLRAHELAAGGAVQGSSAAPGDGNSAVPAMPALAWLEVVLLRLPASTATILTFMPTHVVVQPPPGSAAFLEDEGCKARIALIAAGRRATVVDFRQRSPVTVEDSNYWDPLHYRIGIAERIAQSLWAAYAQGAEAQDGFDRILTRGGELRPTQK
jgi:hypothetical protein